MQSLYDKDLRHKKLSICKKNLQNYCYYFLTHFMPAVSFYARNATTGLVLFCKKEKLIHFFNKQ